MSFLLLASSQLALAEAKVDAIDDVTLTSCLTTRVKFNQDALKKYQGSALSLKVEDESGDEARIEPVTEKNGVFVWEKAIPVSENLTFTLLKDNAPISYPFSKETRNQLTKVIAPTQMAQADTEEGVFVRGLSAGEASKKDLPISIAKDLASKDLLVVVVSDDGKSLWQQYGKVDGPSLVAKVPSDANFGKPHIVANDTVCK
ncbi:MAG: hypothetical protein WAX77_11050 [Methylococcaceae bacterium]